MTTLFHWLSWLVFRRSCPTCGGRETRRPIPPLLFGGRETAYEIPCPERFHDRIDNRGSRSKVPSQTDHKGSKQQLVGVESPALQIRPL